MGNVGMEGVQKGVVATACSTQASNALLYTAALFCKGSNVWLCLPRLIVNTDTTSNTSGCC